MIRRRYLLSACIGAPLALGGLARADEPSKEQLLQKLDAMQAQVDAQHQQMQAQQSQINQLQSQLKQTQDTTQAAVKEQADTITKLSEQAGGHGRYMDMPGINGGFDRDRGFFIQSDDGQSLFHPFVLFQGRNGLISSSSGKADGFVEIGMDGSLFTKDLTYNFTVNYDNSSGINLQYSWLQYICDHKFLDNNYIGSRFGLFKNPVFKEQGIIGDGNQLMVAPSLANAMIGGVATGPLVRSLDIVMVGNDSPIHAEIGGDAGPSPNQYISPPVFFTNATGPARVGFYGRADYKVFGDWADTTDLTGKNKGHDNLLDIGGGIDITEFRDTTVYRLTVDTQYLLARNTTAFAAIYFDHFDGGGSRTDYGGVLEGGYFITPSTQLTARYSLVRGDPGFKISSDAVFNELAIGGNYYFGDHGSWGNHLKLTGDLDYLPEGAPQDGDLDYYTRAGKSQFVLRLQLQFWL